MIKALLPDLGTCQESVCCLKMISASKYLTWDDAHHLTYYTKTLPENDTLLLGSLLGNTLRYTKEEKD